MCSRSSTLGSARLFTSGACAGTVAPASSRNSDSASGVSTSTPADEARRARLSVLKAQKEELDRKKSAAAASRVEADRLALLKQEEDEIAKIETELKAHRDEEARKEREAAVPILDDLQGKERSPSLRRAISGIAVRDLSEEGKIRLLRTWQTMISGNELRLVGPGDYNTTLSTKLEDQDMDLLRVLLQNNPTLTRLGLGCNNLTSFSGTDLSSLTRLDLGFNNLTSFSGTGLSSLTSLNLARNNLTSFSGTGLSSLTYLDLYSNNLTSFSGTGLSSLTSLNLARNNLTSFSGTGLSSLTGLNLDSNNLTSFSGTGLSSLTWLSLGSNNLTSFSGTGLSSLTSLWLSNNQLTSFTGEGLSSLTRLRLKNNPIKLPVTGKKERLVIPKGCELET